MIKKIISLLMMICIISLGISEVVSATGTDATPPSIPTIGDVWDGTTLQPSVLIQKDGVYYYEITKCSQLAYVAENGGDWLTYNYILGNNLILNNIVLTFDDEDNCTNTETLLKWTPIKNFEGILDGNGYTISGMYISNGNNSALFSSLTGSAKITNITITNSFVNGTNAAGFCACFEFEDKVDISNCTFSGVVKGVKAGGIAGFGNGVGYCKNYGSIYATSYAGGIVGHVNDDRYSKYKTVEHCNNYGEIFSDEHAGGIAGLTYGTVGSCNNCKNYGKITGNITGGIVAQTESSCTGSCNEGDVISSGIAGGICGIGAGAKSCVNKANVTGNEFVGGVVGEVMDAWSSNPDIERSVNYGKINGNKYVGGICGAKQFLDETNDIRNCYNLGQVIGKSYIGGITGENIYQNIQYTYSYAEIYGESNVGGISGNSDHIWGRSSLDNNFYLENEAYYACGNVSENVNGQAEEKNALELKDEITFAKWDFYSTWSISAEKNGGYPYLQWQDDDSLTSIPVTSLLISQSTINLLAGKSVYLSVNITPTNATSKTVLWSSSNKSVATVDANGKVTGVSSGTAIITASSGDGNISDSCEVTVEADAWQEYQINYIAIKDTSGKELTSIPNDNFLSSISITNISSGSDTMVVLAKYSDKGAFEGLMYVSAEDMPIGSTIKLTLPIDNKNGDVAKLKAFSWESFNSLTPMGNSASFPAE